MNFLPKESSSFVFALAAIACLIVFVIFCVWGWNKIQRTLYGRSLFGNSKNRQSPSSSALQRDQFVFDEDANELQSRLEEKLSSSDSVHAMGARRLNETSTKGHRQTKKDIGHASTGILESPDSAVPQSNNSGNTTTIDKAELERLVNAVEALQPPEHSLAATLIDADEIERLSFHLDSSNREIASLREELATQTQRIGQLELDAPDTLRKNTHKKITLLANSLIERNTAIKALGTQYTNNVTRAAQLAKTDPELSQNLLKQCKVIKLQIKIQGQGLEKERLLMSQHTRVHKALQLPIESRMAALMQLIDQTNEIKDKNANLKSLVDNLHAEFNQLQSIIDGLKANMDKRMVSQNALTSNKPSRLGHDGDNNAEEQRLAANDSRIASAARSADKRSIQTIAKNPSNKHSSD